MVKEQNQFNTYSEEYLNWNHIKNNHDKTWTIEVKVYDSEGDILDTGLYDLGNLRRMITNDKYEIWEYYNGDHIKIIKGGLA